MVPNTPEHAKPENQIAMEEAMRRLKRRGRLWLLLKLLVVLLAALVGGLFYLQSSHALKHIYLPLLAKRIGAQVTADDGSIGLSGKANFVNLEICGADGAPAFRAGTVTLKAAPLSLLPGRNPVIREAAADAVQARVYIDKDGRTNWDFLTPKKTRAATTATVARQPKTPRKPASETLSIEKFKLTNAALQVQNAQQLDLTLTALDLSLADFAPGKEGAFGMTAEGYLDRPGIHHTFSASGQGTLSRDASGRELGWNGKLDAAYTPEAQPGATTQTVTLKGALAGKATPAEGRLDQTFNLTAKTPGGPGGEFKGTVAWDPAQKKRQALIEAVSVDRELLNPVLAMVGPVQLVRSQLSGKCQLQGAGDVVQVDANVTGRELVFRVGAGEATPPVNIDFAQRGAFDTAKQLLKLDAAKLTLHEGGKPLLTAALDQPVALQVGQGAAAGANAPSAHINTTLNALPVRTLQPWLALAGVKEAEKMRGGALNGQVLAIVGNAGATIALDGKIQAAGLALPEWRNLPLDVEQTLKGRIEKLDVVTIEAARTLLNNNGALLADVAMQGRLKISSGETQATVKMNCPQAAQTARTLGLFEPGTIEIRQDGRLESEETLTLGGKGRPASVKGSASLAGIVLAGQGGAMPLTAKADYQFTADAKTFIIHGLKAAWSAGEAKAAGALEAKGVWPRQEDGKGELRLSVRGADLAPWLRLTRPGATARTLPLEADEALVALGGGARKVSGEMRLGPIPGDGIPANLDPPASVKIKHNMAQLGDVVQSLTLQLSSQSRKGVEDQAALTGKGKWGADGIALQLSGKITALHADGYLALAGMAQPADGGKAGKPTAALETEWMVAEAGAKDAAPTRKTGKSSAKKSAAPAATPAPKAEPAKAGAKRPAPDKAAGTRSLVIQVAPLEIASLTYRGSQLTAAKGSLRHENGFTEFKLDQGKIFGGGIAGSGQYDAAKAEPRYAWELALKQVELQPIVGAIRPDWARRFSGKGDVASRGSGQGLGEAAKRRLQSESGFTLTRGEIRDLPVLDALAKETRMDEFRTLKYDEFSGRITTDDGVATLKDWSERGSQQKVSMEGTVTLDGRYDLLFQPAVSKSAAGKLSKNDLAAQLLTDAHGFLTFPFQVAVSGQGSDYKLGARATLGKEGKEQLNQNLRGVLQGVIEQQLEKRSGKDKKKKDKQEAPAEDGATDSGGAKRPAVDDGGAAPSQTPGDDSKSLEKKDKRGGLEDLLNQGLQQYQDRQQKKKEKKRKKD